MTQEQYRAEASRLKKEIKNLNASRASLTDPEEIESARAQVHKLQVKYNEVLQKLKEIKKEYEWEKSVGREFDAFLYKKSQQIENLIEIAFDGVNEVFN